MKDIDTSGKYQTIDLEASSDDRLLEWYNAHSGGTPLSKFADRATALKKCGELKTAMDELAARPTSNATNKKEKKKKMKNGKTEKKAKAKVKAPKKGAKVKANGKKKKAANGNGAPRISAELADRVITKLVKENPRREDTIGHASWELIKPKMTYAEYIAAGGRNKDLRWDIEKGYAKLGKK